MKLPNHVIGIRAQDFHEGLKEVGGLAQKDIYFRKTLRIGKAAALAMHLKGLNVVADHEALVAMCSILGIGADEMLPVIRELQEISFIRSARIDGDVVKRLELSIPELRDGYADLGQRLLDLGPTDHEQTGLLLVQEAIRVPQSEASVVARLGLDAEVVAVVKDVVTSGGLVDTYERADGAVLYSPLMVEENARALVELSKRYPEEAVVGAFDRVRSYQGIPEEDIAKVKDEVLTTAVATGALQPVTLDGPGVGGRRFYFTPKGGLPPERRVILDKARALLAGVRCGQRYATATPIKYPRSLLRRLKEQRGFSKAHSDLATQYGLVVSKGMGVLERVGSRWSFKLHDTPENLAAVDLAIELLETGETTTASIDVEARELMNVSGSYAGPVSTRARIKRPARRSKAGIADIYEKMAKITRGIEVGDE